MNVSLPAFSVTLVLLSAIAVGELPGGILVPATCTTEVAARPAVVGDVNSDRPAH